MKLNLAFAKNRPTRDRMSRVLHVVAGVALIASPMQYASAELAQAPLFLGGGNVPDNLVLTPSVEYPTIQSLANLGAYSSSARFEGYFDPEKCYRYDYNGNNSDDNHFYPTALPNPGSPATCGGADEWSGNFLNWATTQTIDPFRKALTGGYRVKDTPTETWLEKARHPGQSGLSIREISDSGLIAGATPFNSGVWRIRVRIQGLETDMRFSLNNAWVDDSQRWYDPSDNINVNRDRSYRAAMRVKVCDSSFPETNCKQYSQGMKPEGLIQQNARDIRYSVFGYLNDNSSSRDGGVLRARQKYVGPEKFEPGDGYVDNPAKEWDPVTGVYIRNPDSADAAATYGTVSDSGVINYLNGFGQLNSNNHKTLDPVSELYYAATRYLKNQGNVASYSSNLNATRVDNFPVISDWEDPIQYECQTNVILGIGDVNTHDDKNLPGNTTYRSDEPAVPSEVTADDTVNVIMATNKVGQLEGIGTTLGQTNNFTGRQNSAYIAGLAYDNNTKDMRPDLAGEQRASTYWVDVLENEVLEPIQRNQYYLAAKYGGFKPSEGTPDFDPYARTTPLDNEWWHSSGETVSWGGTSFPRPDNFYIAGEATRMISSLRQAFTDFREEMNSSAASVATNSTSLQADTAIFQASFDSSRWSGDLKAFAFNADNTVSSTAIWSAATELDGLSDFQTDNRQILTATPLTASGDVLSTTTGREFTWADLTSAQRTLLGEEERLDYLRGDRSNERNVDDQSRPYRERGSRLGDIVNSAPQYVHQQSFGYYQLPATTAFSGIGSYRDFRLSADYLTRPPLLLVGANDGMLHGFNASVAPGGGGGRELFAYVPSSAYEHLAEIADPDYEHRYYVDGTPRVSDAWLGSSLGWRTLAVGTTGAGGRSVFALDITDPSNMDETDVLWEFSHTDMGYTVQQPSIFAMPNGEFGVAVSSGYDTGNSTGKVWILNAGDGSVMATFELPTEGGELGSPNLIDLDRDRIADRMYVADTNGQVWRVDFDGDNANSWGIPASLQQGSTDYPLFEAKENQPITADLVATLNENGDIMVFFGTGSFQNVGEQAVPANPPVQSFYGIVDRGERIEWSDLLQQEIEAELVQSGNRLRLVTSNEPGDADTYEGWYMDLVVDGNPKGERVVSRALVRGDRVIFPTLIPSEDPCAAGGQSWLMEVDLYSGGELSEEVFDIDNDSDIDGCDRVSATACNSDPDDPTNPPTDPDDPTDPGDPTDPDDPTDPGDPTDPDDPNNNGEVIYPDNEPYEGRIPSGVNPEIGIIDTPTIITDGDGGDETKVVSGSSGDTETVRESGGALQGRLTWEQLR